MSAGLLLSWYVLLWSKVLAAVRALKTSSIPPSYLYPFTTHCCQDLAWCTSSMSTIIGTVVQRPNMYILQSMGPKCGHCLQICLCVFLSLGLCSTRWLRLPIATTTRCCVSPQSTLPLTTASCCEPHIHPFHSFNRFRSATRSFHSFSNSYTRSDTSIVVHYRRISSASIAPHSLFDNILKTITNTIRLVSVIYKPWRTASTHRHIRIHIMTTLMTSKRIIQQYLTHNTIDHTILRHNHIHTTRLSVVDQTTKNDTMKEKAYH